MIQSKGGESIKGMSIKDAELIEHGARVAETVGIVGPANVQCFREPDGSLPVTDVNPRFGGAFPLPLAAGSRYPELALALARGERPEPRLGDFREGVLMTRFFSGICLGRERRRHARGRWTRGSMARYVVTGAAGFIGSHLAEALAGRATRSSAIDCFTDYYDPALKEENARGLDVRRLDLAADELDFAGFDGVFHLAGQPGVRSFGDVFDALPAPQRARLAAPLRGGGPRRRPRRLRVVVVGLRRGRALPDARGRPMPRPLSPYGITKLACEHLARAYARSFGLDVVVLRYFNAFGPRQRPDMAFTAHRRSRSRRAARSTSTATGSSRAASRTSPTSSTRRSLAHGARRAATYNVGGGDGGDDARHDRDLERLAGRTLEVRGHPAVPGDQRRTQADTTRIRGELGWEPTSRFEEGLAAQWDWAAARVARAMSDAADAAAIPTPSARSTSARRGARITARWWLPRRRAR